MSSKRARSKTDVLQGRLYIPPIWRLAPLDSANLRRQAPFQQNVYEKRPFQIVHIVPAFENETKCLDLKMSPKRARSKTDVLQGGAPLDSANRQSTGARRRATSTKCGRKTRAPSESTIPAFEMKKNVVKKRAFQKIVHTCV